MQTSSTKEVLNIAIIGAGLTGLMTAHLLEQAFGLKNKTIKISIFEKSAGVGRLATRYKKPESNNELQWQFDFGAQFFTAKSEGFRAYLQPWIKRGVIQPWLATTASINLSFNTQQQIDSILEIQITGEWDNEQPRYIAKPKMTSFGQALADNLYQTKINFKTRVAPLVDDPKSTVNNQNLSEKAAKTTLVDEQGNKLGSFDWVVFTAPQAQTIELLQQTRYAYLENIKRPQMLACYTLMLGWGQRLAGEEGSDLPEKVKNAKWEVLQVNTKTDKDLPINRLFMEHHKPGRESILPSITIHADNQWSEAQVDSELAEVQQQLLQTTRDILQWEDNQAPKWIDCHRWRYAATKQPTADDCVKEASTKISYVDSDKQWIVAGDWCDEGRIESCYKAASKVVEAISG